MSQEATVGDQANNEHRISDALFVAGARAPLYLAKLSLGDAAVDHGESEILLQTRVGQNGELFQLEKLRTQYADTGVSYSRTAEFFRRVGIDELAQAANVRAGNMSLFGWRPLIPVEHEMFLEGIEDSKIRDRWIKLVLPTKPGPIGSYGIGNHVRQVRGIETMWGGKAELDIQDVVDDSFSYRVKMLKKLLDSLNAPRIKHED